MGEPCSPNGQYCVRHKRHLRECNAALTDENRKLREAQSPSAAAYYDLWQIAEGWRVAAIKANPKLKGIEVLMESIEDQMRRAALARTGGK